MECTKLLAISITACYWALTTSQTTPDETTIALPLGYTALYIDALSLPTGQNEPDLLSPFGKYISSPNVNTSTPDNHVLLGSGADSIISSFGSLSTFLSQRDWRLEMTAKIKKIEGVELAIGILTQNSTDVACAIGQPQMKACLKITSLQGYIVYIRPGPSVVYNAGKYSAAMANDGMAVGATNYLDSNYAAYTCSFDVGDGGNIYLILQSYNDTIHVHVGQTPGTVSDCTTLAAKDGVYLMDLAPYLSISAIQGSEAELYSLKFFALENGAAATATEVSTTSLVTPTPTTMINDGFTPAAIGDTASTTIQTTSSLAPTVATETPSVPTTAVLSTITVMTASQTNGIQATTSDSVPLSNTQSSTAEMVTTGTTDSSTMLVKTTTVPSTGVTMSSSNAVTTIGSSSGIATGSSSSGPSSSDFSITSTVPSSLNEKPSTPTLIASNDTEASYLELSIKVQQQALQQIATDNGLTDNPSQFIQNKIYQTAPPDTPAAAVDSKRFLEECDEFSPQLEAPVTSNNGPMPIQGLFAVDKLIRIDSVHENITVLGMFFMRWAVLTCSPNSTDSFELRPIEKMIIVGEDDIWTPKYFITSSSGNIYMNRNEYSDDNMAFIQKKYVQPNLNPLIDFYQSRYGYFRSDCRLEIRKFPFDEQTCRFSFTLEASIQLAYFARVDILCPTSENTEWTFKKCTNSSDMSRFDGKAVQVANFYLTLSRKPSYYIVSSVLPSLCLALLGLASFLMPGHQPDRPVLGVTLLLALTVAMSDVLKNIPRTSTRILLSDYILFMTYFAALVTFYHMVICFLANIDHGKKYRRRIVFRKFHNGISFIRALDLVATIVAVTALFGVHLYASLVISAN